jgi:hypothetical protein
MAYEVESDGMSAEARFILMECASASATCLNIGVDPLEILLQLEQLAMEDSHDIHDYIRQFLGEL